MPHLPAPLTGYRVLDLTRILAGPFCSMILGDYGADVIKVEGLAGDDTRTWGPPFAPSVKPGATPESSYYLGINRNKRSIAINFKTQAGLRIIYNLAKTSDVLIENYVPGKLDSLGLGYDRLREINPALIYASITGYGPTGPSAKLPGYDVIIEGEAGLMHITGEPNQTPVKVGVAITDITTGLFLHGAITAALLARERAKTPEGKMIGQKIDVSLLESQVAALANVAHAYLIGGVEAKRWGTQHPSIVPYQAFQTKDSYVIVGAGNDSQYQKLCKALQRDDLGTNEKYSTNQLRVANRVQLLETLSAIFKQKSTDKWLNIIRPTGIPCGPVNNISQTFNHPQVLHRNMVEEVDHPTAGKIKLVGIPVKYSETKPTIRMPPPLLGEHTDEVLSELLDYKPQEIEQLRRDGVIL